MIAMGCDEPEGVGGHGIPAIAVIAVIAEIGKSKTYHRGTETRRKAKQLGQ
jgi:hypothetical protein